MGKEKESWREINFLSTVPGHTDIHFSPGNAAKHETHTHTQTGKRELICYGKDSAIKDIYQLFFY